MRIAKGTHYKNKNYYYSPTTANSVCPEGWRLPNKKDLSELFQYVENTVGVSVKDPTDFQFTLNEKFCFQTGNTGYIKFDFEKGKYYDKLQKWHNNKWIIGNDNVKSLENGAFNSIPKKFFRKSSGQWGKFELARSDMSWFWLSDITYENLKPFTYVTGIGKEEVATYYNDTALFFPCRCVKDTNGS